MAQLIRLDRLRRRDTAVLAVLAIVAVVVEIAVLAVLAGLGWLSCPFRILRKLYFLASIHNPNPEGGGSAPLSKELVLPYQRPIFYLK